MNKFIKVALVGAVLATLTACTGHIEFKVKIFLRAGARRT